MIQQTKLLVTCLLVLNSGLVGLSNSEKNDGESFNLSQKKGFFNETLLPQHSSSVKKLKISNCDFEDVSIETFKSMTNLKKLTILDSHFGILPEGVFQVCPKLKQIEIKRTKIDNLDPGTFANLTKLEEFEIEDSEIKELKPNMFIGCSDLEEFECNKCRMKSVNPGAFNGINLTELKLKDNNLEEIPFRNFPKMSKMKSIDLSGNTLTKLNVTGLKETFPNLKKIKLKRTNIPPETLKEIEQQHIKVKTGD